MTPTSLWEILDNMTANVQAVYVNTSRSLIEKSHHPAWPLQSFILYHPGVISQPVNFFSVRAWQGSRWFLSHLFRQKKNGTFGMKLSWRALLQLERWMALSFNENTRYTFHVLIQRNPAHSARQCSAAKSIPVELQTLLLEKGLFQLHVYL